ncbi:hypothetical protein ACC691_37120, partial [Rhizobium johnstonii]
MNETDARAAPSLTERPALTAQQIDAAYGAAVAAADRGASDRLAQLASARAVLLASVGRSDAIAAPVALASAPPAAPAWNPAPQRRGLSTGAIVGIVAG